MACAILSACSNSDDKQVLAAAEQYWNAWHRADEQAMADVLHDRLAKRAVLKIPENGKFPADQNTIWQENGYYLHDQGKSSLVGKTRKRNPTPEHNRGADIELLDRRGNAAVVKIATGGGVDYLQLARVDKHWYVINVLWAMGKE